jgi:hypothetical protein
VVSRSDGTSGGGRNIKINTVYLSKSVTQFTLSLKKRHPIHSIQQNKSPNSLNPSRSVTQFTQSLLKNKSPNSLNPTKQVTQFTQSHKTLNSIPFKKRHPTHLIPQYVSPNPPHSLKRVTQSTQSLKARHPIHSILFKKQITQLRWDPSI